MSDQKTEKPTQKRLQKARKEGQFPVSRGMFGAVQFTALVVVLGAWGWGWFAGVQAMTLETFRLAFRPELTRHGLTEVCAATFKNVFLPLIGGGAVVFLAPFAVHLAGTRFGFALKALAPSANKLNPFQKILKMPKQNLGQVAQAVAVLALCGAAGYSIAGSRASELYRLPLTSLDDARRTVMSAIDRLLWDAALLLLAVGAVDFGWQRFRFSKQMKMSRQEIRDEYREVEGNPQSKARLRRMRRDQARRRMLRLVVDATAVVVNPTHYAVALQYDSNKGGAPILLAKGRNYLAMRIRKLAETHGVPIVENPPLARALYKSVPLGGEIPSTLYRAVAEVLAYVYRRVGLKA
jgi:flagellar biosynthetic protein FlhB